MGPTSRIRSPARNRQDQLPGTGKGFRHAGNARQIQGFPNSAPVVLADEHRALALAGGNGDGPAFIVDAGNSAV